MARRKQTSEKPRKPAGHRAHRVSATEAARNFSDLINRVRYGRATFVVERGGLAMCEIRPVYGQAGFTGKDLVELLRSLPGPGDEYLDHVESAVKNQPPAEQTRWRR